MMEGSGTEKWKDLVDFQGKKSFFRLGQIGISELTDDM
ncbi:hypothetical protein J3R74_000747 [Puniceicoccus vermicola]